MITKLYPLRAIFTTTGASSFSTLLRRPANFRSLGSNLHIFLKQQQKRQNETKKVCGKLTAGDGFQEQNFHSIVALSPPEGIVLGKNRYDDNEEEKAGYRTPGNDFRYPLLQELQPQRRMYHTTARSERAAVLVMGLATVSALGFAGSSAINSFNEWKASQPTKADLEEMRNEQEKKEEKSNEQHRGKNSDSDQPRTNIFHEWFDVGTKYYEGGFEDTMTKREAALVLGIRESASPARVKDAHRKLLILNHPDTGGSTFLAGKLNEAKELLLKGKSQRRK